ncbi:MAG TPA: hypothetical protein VMV46_02775 [Thermoanaerobaculia bacterium]|nr:hypothetical protein [Thermoanaerobaculia bacterium]
MALGAAATPARSESPDEASARAATLRAVAALALPAVALGPRRLEDAVVRFERWRDGFQPVAELDHPYLSTDQIQYGPPDPRPAWEAQLDALELESRQRWERGFVDAASTEREELLRLHLARHLPRGGGESPLPEPARAPHVAIGLMAWFYSTPAANDLCYGRAIRRHTCRGLPSAVEEPPPLAGEPLFTED